METKKLKPCQERKRREQFKFWMDVALTEFFRDSSLMEHFIKPVKLPPIDKTATIKFRQL